MVITLLYYPKKIGFANSVLRWELRQLIVPALQKKFYDPQLFNPNSQGVLQRIL